MNVTRQIRAARTIDGATDAPVLTPRPSPASRRLLGTCVNATSYQHVLTCLGSWVANRRSAYVCVSSVHSLMEAHDDTSFNEILNRADLVTPDGMPLVWGLRLLGVSQATRVYGPELTEHICAWAADKQVPVGFHGSTDAVLDRMITNLCQRYPELHVAYRHSPPFRSLMPDERRQEIEAIHASGARILFVGLGCPKQERWMADRQDDLDLVMLGVGAAFDYLAETVPRPPELLQQLGLEWLFRLLNDPRRLWRRYLRHNPRFVYLFTRQLVRTRLKRESA
jgi:N-acetylglucosaminyldiphosphoundecaprenol N-acetyl-beta-D-mannosaminyltransferase